MAGFVPFESVHVKDEQRQQKRERRQVLLDQAKKEYEKEQRKQELAKLRGEDKWMLPSLEKRIDQEMTEMKEMKSKKHKKEKKKKKKKEKKKKKRKTSDSESSSEESEQDMWVEKGAEKKIEPKPLVKGPQLQRDSWMEAPLDLIPTTSRQEIRDQIEKDKEEKNREKNLLDQPGQHEKELNPYWRGGGAGLPEEQKKDKKLSQMSLPSFGDGGLSWMKKAYQRCEEQAKEEGRTLEAVATEKYGSLKKLESMLNDAKKANRKLLAGEKESKAHSPQRERKQESSHARPRSRDRYQSRRSRSKSRDRDRHQSKRSTSRERDRHQSRRSRSRSRDRERYQSRRSRSRDRYQSRRSRSRDRDRYRRSRSNERQRSNQNSTKRRFIRPGDSDEDNTQRSEKAKPRTKFRKPDSDGSGDDGSLRERSSSRREEKYVPSWKKKEFRKPEDNMPTKKESSSRRDTEKHKRHYSSSSSSSSESESESSESESDDPQKNESNQPPPQEEKILTEQEMNQLGAKIVKAEIMGDDELASKLKLQLETSRKLLEERKANPKQSVDEDDNVIVLTRTSKDGLVRPIDSSQHERPLGKNRKKKKEKVDTHSKHGERQKYFDDDDKFDLKKLVEREKMGTAEDQNSMYARLAGRSVEKTDADFDVDDMFLSKAAHKQSEAKIEERDRVRAIEEHRKVSAATQKCQFCFENISKHLIVAIGTKAFLCVPNHRSLTDGHCLIVPMQHVASSTAMDEDVWNEIQVFRKALVKMYEDRDEDAVFMETSMGLRHYPHMHLECIPMPRETGDLAPIYFKKAIQESESEWSDNKKLISLSEKNIRRAVPKGFPYFCVDFGLQGGFAHVIEDEQLFPRYFGREVVGGMIDAEPLLWRKPHKENFDNQRKKVMEFAEVWKPYDWTSKLSDDS